jgi:hypothetical protein
LKFILAIIFSIVTITGCSPNNQVHNGGGYSSTQNEVPDQIVWKDNVYKVSNETIPDDKITQQVGQTAGAGLIYIIYGIRGIDEQKSIAIKVNNGFKKANFIRSQHK